MRDSGKKEVHLSFRQQNEREPGTHWARIFLHLLCQWRYSPSVQQGVNLGFTEAEMGIEGKPP